MVRGEQAELIAARGDRIVATARRLAEADGWSAVTVRRLAAAVGYSQPVLYGHFPRGRSAIITAAAVEGFAELNRLLVTERIRRSTPKARLEAVIRAYLTFAEQSPATYAAMFSEPVTVEFAAAARTPPELREGFSTLAETLAEMGPSDAIDVRTELLWSTLHGMATLERAARLPTAGRRSRRNQLVRSLTPPPTR